MNSKSACDSVQVQTVPGSSHHNLTQQYYYASLLSMLYWSMRLCDCCVKHSQKTPSVWSCIEILHWSTHPKVNTCWTKYSWLSPKYTLFGFPLLMEAKRGGLDATGTYVDLVWCQQGRLGHLCARSKHLLLAIAYLRHQKKLLQRMLSLWISSSHHLRMQPLFLQPKERLWQTAFVGTTPHNLSAEFRVKPVLTTILVNLSIPHRRDQSSYV